MDSIMKWMYWVFLLLFIAAICFIITASTNSKEEPVEETVIPDISTFLNIPSTFDTGEDLQFDAPYYMDSTTNIHAQRGLYTLEYNPNFEYCTMLRINDDNQELSIGVTFCPEQTNTSTVTFNNLYITPEMKIEIENLLKVTGEDEYQEDLKEDETAEDLDVRFKLTAQDEIIDLQLDDIKPGVYNAGKGLEPGSYLIDAKANSQYYVIDDNILKAFDPNNMYGSDDDEIKIDSEYQFDADEGDCLVVLNGGLTITEVE